LVEIDTSSTRLHPISYREAPQGKKGDIDDMRELHETNKATEEEYTKGIRKVKVRTELQV
jgi:hypothetical protein